MKINFDADNHIYYTDAGEIIPGVSEILRSCDGFWVPQSEPHRKDGHKKHSILYDYNEYGNMFVPANSDDAWIVEKWKEVKKQYGFEIVNCEKAVYHPELGYAGTYDVLCRQGDALVLIDFKTGQGVNNDYAALQLWAYAEAYDNHAKKQIKKRKKDDFDLIYGAAVLVINPKVNKQGWRLKELPDKRESFKRLLWEFKRGVIPFEGLKNKYSDMPF